MKWRWALVAFMITAASGCVHIPPPLLEYTLADTAIKAAQNVQAVRYAPDSWNEARESFRQAQILYNEREYEQARDLFNKARAAAEKSETAARLIRQRNGEVF